MKDSQPKRKVGRIAGCCLAAAVFFAGCARNAEPRRILLPKLSAPWSAENRVLGSDSAPVFYSDFLLIKDRAVPARWHMIGIHKEGNTLYHAVSDSLTGGWTLRADIESSDSVVRMWAPYAIWAPDGERAYMFYHHGLGTDTCAMRNSMRVLAAPGPALDRWSDYDVFGEPASLPGIGNVAFEGDVPRDACIFFDERLGRYIMYHAENTPRAILARTSDDALHWSDPVAVMTTPAPRDGFVSPESPFVLCRDGLYYLFVSGFDYARVALYVSEDPFDFGDPEANKICELNGHAPEIVEEDGTYYMGCAHIASRPGMGWGAADLWGTYIQELVWEPADSAALAKIVRRGPEGKRAAAIGSDRDEHGCIGSAGYRWSELLGECIRVFEAGVCLVDTAASGAAYAVFGPDSLKAELFLPGESSSRILDRRKLPQGGYAWNEEDDDTPNLRRDSLGWVIERRGVAMYREKTE